MSLSDRRTLMRASLGVVLLLLMISVAPATTSAARRSQWKTLSPGVTYLKKSISGPNQLNLIRVDAQTAATIDVVPAGNTLPSYAKTSVMGANNNAVVAVNGDFGLSPGRPGHALAQDGELLQTSPLGADGKNFAARYDKTGGYIGGQNLRIKIKDPSAANPISVDLWNDAEPGNSEVAGYTSFGGTVSEPPKKACSARLLTAGPLTWSPVDGVRRDYTVDERRCGALEMSLNSGIVIATPSAGSRTAEVNGLTVGETVEVSWTFGWPSVLDSVGGSPVLIEGGQIVVENCSSYLCDQHPRTAVGIASDGDILIAQIDGRSNLSVGMTLLQLAREMRDRGAVWAMNLDGGGSSTMWIDGKGVVNTPSEDHERSVTNALLVLPGPDPTDPPSLTSPSGPAPAWAGTASSPQVRRRLTSGYNAAIGDPASTGGLLDALANGDLGDDAEIPSDMRPALRTFRLSHR